MNLNSYDITPSDSQSSSDSTPYETESSSYFCREEQPTTSKASNESDEDYNPSIQMKSQAHRQIMNLQIKSKNNQITEKKRKE
jgi:hypothetical protein